LLHIRRNQVLLFMLLQARLRRWVGSSRLPR
jgi:hypothetical protein